MFEGFARHWTPLRFSDEVKSKTLVACRLAGEKVVLFRDADGRARAFIDRCPHRGVELSLGRITRDGCVECPFHGWRFAADGTNTRIPWSAAPTARPERFAATSLPCRELGGMVWVYTSTVDEPPEDPAVPDALIGDGVARFRHAEDWDTHWTRAMENMLDSPHLPFVHRRTIGRALRPQLRRGDSMVVDVQEEPQGMRVTFTVGDEPGRADLRWFRPNGMELDLAGGDIVFRQHVWCVPVDATTVRMMLTSARSIGGDNPVSRTFDRFNRIILGEDRRVVESSDPPEIPPPDGEANVATDRATLAFRRWYHAECRSSSA